MKTLNAMNTNDAMLRNAALMYYALVTPMKHRLCIVSPPGFGKTSVWEQVGKALGCADDHVYRVSVAQCDPSDINGYLMPSGTGADRRVAFEVADAFRRCCDGAPSTILFDEYSNAPRSVQAATLRTLDAGWFGDTKAPDACKLIVAMNPPESAVDAQDIGAAVWNRLTTIEFNAPSKEEHVEHMLRGGAAQHFDFPEFSRESWDKCYQEVTAIYAAWMRKSVSVLIENATSPDVAQRWPMAYCTPRSWDAALRLLTTCRMFGDESAALVLVAGTIGRAQAIPFLAFAKESDLMDPETLIGDDNGPSKWIADAKRPDRTFAQLMSVAMAACETRKTPKETIIRWNRAWDVITRTVETVNEADHLALLAGRYLCSNKPNGPVLSKHAAIIARIAPMVRMMMKNA